jgi:hypothetical protein
MFGRLKDWRRIATRHDRCAHTFMSAICIAPTVIFCLPALSLGRVDKRNSQSAIVMIQCWKLGASHDPRPDRHRSLGADRPVPAA